MPGKKKKYNARFPPARIKKIMQSDEEVGKVAAPVPVIISRALELFVQSLLLKAGDVTLSRGARTLTPSHLKQCIINDQRYDFLHEHFSSVPDISAEGDSEAEVQTPVSSFQTPSFVKKDGTSPSSSATSLQFRNKTKVKTSISQNPPGHKRPRGRPRKVQPAAPRTYSDDIIDLDSPSPESDHEDSAVEIKEINSPVSPDCNYANKTYIPHFYLPKSDSKEDAFTPSTCSPSITFPKGIEISIPGIKPTKTLPKIPDLYSIPNGNNTLPPKSVPVSVITSIHSLAKEKLKTNLSQCTEIDEDYDC